MLRIKPIQFVYSRVIPCVLIFSFSSLLSGCNVFSSLDKPSSDPQLLSAARAAFDKGNMSEALSLYQKLSADSGDIAKSEQAFLKMTEQGASMTALVEFIGNKANGTALTKYAEKLSSGAGETRRLALYDAYTQHLTITDPTLKSFVKFATSLALTAEILAEAASADGILRKENLIASRNCKASAPDPVNCILATDSRILATAGSDLLSSPSGAQPSIDHLYFTILAASDALSSLAPSGKFGDTNSGFLKILDQLGNNKPSSNPLLPPLFLSQLVATDGFNIGE